MINYRFVSNVTKERIKVKTLFLSTSLPDIFTNGIILLVRLINLKPNHQIHS